MATKIVTKNSSTAGSAPSASDLVQGELAVNVVDKRLYTEDNAGNIVELGTNPLGEITANGGIALGDNDKATFGANDDLQIYHDGSNSYMGDFGTGDLYLRASTNLYIGNSGGTASFITAADGGAVGLRFSGSEKLATTATGIDVTGTVTADGVKTDHTDGFYIDNLGTTEASWTHTAATGSSVINVGRSSSWGGDLTIKTDTKSRALFYHNGDISFYEDTGTTPKFFWDASAESLGIGTSSPTSLLTLGTGSFTAAGAGTSALYTDGSMGMVALADGYSWNTRIGIERMRIDSNGNVGIGTSLPTVPLTVNNQSDHSDLAIFHAGGGTPNRGLKISTFANTNTNAGVEFDAQNSTGAFKFSTGGTERMRIDSSGNVLVGTTQTDIGYTDSGAGVVAMPTGLLQCARDSQFASLYIQKLNNDGDHIEFGKDGTKVGSIGYNSGNGFYMHTPFGNDSGLVFGSERIVPCTSTGAFDDAVVDLGYSSGRFKDLYLSGGVYLGGTGAANKLDDYESGTWTPNLLSGTSITYTTTPTGSYTKIGKIVHISASIDVSNSNTADGSGLTIGGLPFSAVGDAMTFTLGRYRSFLAPKDSAVLGAVATSTYIQFFESNNNYILYSEIGSSGVLTFSGTYEAA